MTRRRARSPSPGTAETHLYRIEATKSTVVMVRPNVRDVNLRDRRVHFERPSDSPLRTVARGLWLCGGGCPPSRSLSQEPVRRVDDLVERGSASGIAVRLNNLRGGLGGAIVALVALVGALGPSVGLAIFVALGTGIALLMSAAAYPGGLFATYRVLSRLRCNAGSSGGDGGVGARRLWGAVVVVAGSSADRYGAGPAA